jgi:hypothetical protein
MRAERNYELDETYKFRMKSSTIVENINLSLAQNSSDDEYFSIEEVVHPNSLKNIMKKKI